MMIEPIVNAIDVFEKMPTDFADIAGRILLLFFGLASFGAVGYYYLWEHEQSQRRDPRESGISPLYEETCAGAYARAMSGYPFFRLVRFAFYDDFLIICGVRYFAPVCYCLPYEYISKIRKRSYFPGRYVQITHRKHTIPTPIAIRSRDCAKVEKTLLELTARCKERKNQELAD